MNTNATLRIATDLTRGKTAVFDPAAYNSNASLYMNFIYDQFAYVTPQGLQPGLAQSWSFPDQKTMTLKLRPNLKFQDGTPLDAAAVKFSWDRVIANKTMVKVEAIAAMQSVDVVDPLTVTLHLSKPDAADWRDRLLFDSPNGQGIVSPTAVKNEGADFANHPVGAGPYKFVSYTPGQKVTLERWDGYWDPAGQKLKTVEFIQATSGAPTVTALAGGAVDLALPSVSDVKSLKAQNISVEQAPQNLGTTNIAFCTNKAPFNSLQARQALMYALNRQEFVDTAFQGEAVVNDKFLAPADPSYPKNVADPYPYDVGKAKSTLAAAGLSGAKVVILAASTSPVELAVAQVMQSQLNAAGFAATVQNSTNTFADLKKVPWSLYLSGFSTSGTLPATWSAFILPGGSGNACDYNNADVANAYNGTRDVTLDSAGRAAAWAKYQQAEYAQLPEFEIGNPYSLVAHTSKVKGVTASLLDGGTAAEMSLWKQIYISK